MFHQTHGRRGVEYNAFALRPVQENPECGNAESSCDNFGMYDVVTCRGGRSRVS